MKRLAFITLLFLGSSLVGVEDACISYDEEDLVSDCYMDSCSSCDDYRLSGWLGWMPWIETGQFSGFLEFLYWNPREEGLEYTATYSLATSSIIPPQAPSLDIVTVDSGDYRPGSRIGMGFTPYCSNMDFLTSWTWYYSSVNSTTNNTSVVQVPLLLNPESINLVPGISSSARWDLHYNTVDAEIGYTVSPDYCGAFVFRPKFGVRAAWLYQNLRAYYDNVTLSGFGLTNLISSNQNHFWGVGFHTGADLAWNFGYGWGFYCKGGASLLSGKFNIRQTSKFDSTLPGVSVGSIRNTDVTVHRDIVAAVDLASGFCWTTTTCYCPMEFSVGWEFQLWFSQNQLHTIVDSSNFSRFATFRGDLSLQGIVARANFKF